MKMSWISRRRAMPAVDQVFALARTEQPAGDGDFAGLCRLAVFHGLKLVGWTSGSTRVMVT